MGFNSGFKGLIEFLTLKMGRIDCLETLVTNCHYSLC